jgi:cell division protein FtsL
MNAAAKVIHQSGVFQGQWVNMHLSKRVCLQTVLVILMLISALAVVYVTNLHRITYSKLELAEERKHQLQLQWGQLLLEQASLATPARVEELATEKLHMVLPANKRAFVLRAQ